MPKHREGSPCLTVLTEDDLTRIHEATLTVLERKGVRFSLGEAQDVFREAGLSVDAEGGVRFPPDVIAEVIQSAPSEFTRQPRDPSYEPVRYGQGTLSFTSGSTPIYVLEKGRLRTATRNDIAAYTRLVDGLPNFTSANGGFWAQDIPPSIYHAVYFELMVKNTAKPIPAGDVLNKTIAEDLVRLAAIVLGGESESAEKKTFSLAACPHAACHWGANVAAFIEGAKAGMPVKIMPMPFAGSTHPVTLAGLLVQANAEILSCVALNQLVRPGAPVLYAPYPGVMDMSAANHVYGTPESALLAAAFVQLARRYGIPSDVVVGTTDAKLPDGQAAYEKMMTGLLPALAGADEIALFGGLVSMAEAISLEQLMIDHEIAGNILRMHRGIDTRSGALAVDEILSVPIGGNFLDHPHTLNRFRDELFMPSLADRRVRSDWERHGATTLIERAVQAKDSVLESHEAPPLPEDTLRALDDELRRICKRENQDFTPFRPS